MSSVALAWILRQGDDLVPLVGMGRPENVERNLEALRVPLDEADMAALDVAFPTMRLTYAGHATSVIARLGSTP